MYLLQALWVEQTIQLQESFTAVSKLTEMPPTKITVHFCHVEAGVLTPRTGTLSLHLYSVDLWSFVIFGDGLLIFHSLYYSDQGPFSRYCKLIWPT